MADAVGGLELPALQQLGLGNVLPLAGCPPRADAPAVYGRLAERSLGMDTTTGHWEMMGIVTEQPFPTFPDGFPQELLDRFCAATGRGVIGNVAASGTEIIQRLGEQHQRTGDWIVYTSADSVFQIAAHEQTVPLEELYAACRTARELLIGDLAVGRVIARPFEGEPGAYVRTPRRHDFSLLPPRPNHLQRLRGGRGDGARGRQDRRHLRRAGRRHLQPDRVERPGHRPHDRAGCAIRRTATWCSPTWSRPT